MIHSEDIKSMVTNEEKRNEADRRIPLTDSDMFFEILGNMSGNEQHLYIDLSDKVCDCVLYTYHNDQGFTPQDKEAIKGKNKSGDNSGTVGYNGHGYKLVIDKLLPDTDELLLDTDELLPDTDELLPDTDELLPDKNRAIIYSINDKTKCTLGHFDYTDWEKWNNDNEIDDIISKLKIKPITGSLIKIPLNDVFILNYLNNRKDLLKHCLKFLNIKIARKEVAFYWNGKKQNVDEICPIEGSITINYTLGYDTKTDQLDKNHKKPLLLQINNYSDLDEKAKNILEPHMDISKKRLTEYGNFEYSFLPVESGELVLNIVKQDTNIFNQEWVDGCLPYINNTCIAYKAITKGFPFNHGVETKEYGGKPRFTNHIPKNTILYSVPADKAHITPTSKGMHMNKFIHHFSKIYFNSANVSSSTTSSSVSATAVSATAVSATAVSATAVSATVSATALSAPTSTSADGTSNSPPRSRKKKYDFTDTQKSRAVQEYQVCKKNIYNNPLEPDRCLCCDRFLLRHQIHAGHIQSHDNRGNTNSDNLLPICNRCNNNDIRNIPNMMVEEWGINHINTIRVEKYLKLTNKNLSNVIEELR